LLEPQRINQATYSEDFSSWSNINSVTITSNTATSPDGTINADGIQDTTGSTFKRVRILKSGIGANSTFNCSIFVKKELSEINYGGIALIYQNVSTKTAYGIIDAVNGAIVNGGGTITPIFNVVDFGDYWRFEMTATDDGSNTAVEFAIYPTLSSNGTSLGVGAGSVRTIWGAQLEEAIYSTSYIPTSGTTVTRAADSATGAGDASTFNSEQGILFLEVAALINDATVRLWSLSNGTTLNRVFLGFGGASNNIRFRVQVANVYQAEDDTTISDVTAFNKIALLYKENNFKLYINGSLALSDTSGSTFTSGTLDRFNFDSAAGSSIPYSKCKDLRYYDTEGMTDTEINNLLTQLTQ